MPTVKKLNVIPKPLPNTRTVLEPAKDFEGPFFTGDEDINYVCGNCGYLLAKEIREGQIRDIVVRCPKCGQYNEFPP